LQLQDAWGFRDALLRLLNSVQWSCSHGYYICFIWNSAGASRQGGFLLPVLLIYSVLSLIIRTTNYEYGCKSKGIYNGCLRLVILLGLYCMYQSLIVCAMINTCNVAEYNIKFNVTKSQTVRLASVYTVNHETRCQLFITLENLDGFTTTEARSDEYSFYCLWSTDD